ncbi:Nn.00g052950.m01.CDS01 [Neocucurbitaria sp. VM-36]
MVVVAVIGGTGSVGKTIVEAFQEDRKHDVIIFARKVPEGGHVAPVFVVDYDNVGQLTASLVERNVHTVISTIAMYDPTAAQAERNFVAAASKSSTTKRFIASNWGTAPPGDESLRLPFHIFREQILQALRKTDLEWTQIYNGFFLDYYGMPHIETHLSPLLMSFTYTKDLGKFVVAAQSLPIWEPALYCYSDNTSLSQILHTAEIITGSKFNVSYDPVEKLQRGEITELPSHLYLYKYFPKPLLALLLSKFGLWALYGHHSVPKEGSLNERFPDITTATMTEVVGAWKGK